MGYYKEIMNKYEKVVNVPFESYKSNILNEIGNYTVEMKELYLTERFDSVQKYISIFEEMINNISTSETKGQIIIFYELFENYKQDLLMEFKIEFSKKYDISIEDKLVSITSITELYKDLKNIYHLFTGNPILTKK